jgi:hypothetical protein
MQSDEELRLVTGMTPDPWACAATIRWWVRAVVEVARGSSGSKCPGKDIGMEVNLSDLHGAALP